MRPFLSLEAVQAKQCQPEEQHQVDVECEAKTDRDQVVHESVDCEGDGACDRMRIRRNSPPLDLVGAWWKRCCRGDDHHFRIGAARDTGFDTHGGVR
ncbi:hypothetical protein D3C81_1737900 [compost metagenome]